MIKQATFTVIHGKKQVDNFMKGADLFRGKNLGAIDKLTIEYTERKNLTLTEAKKAITLLKEALEQAGQVVSYVHLEKIQNGDTIKLNTKIKPYYDSSAREVSDGKKAFVLKDFIEKTTHFRCKTDENFYIIDIL